jgi:23S rRNA (adenine2503-C2)-methyltransferase
MTNLLAKTPEQIRALLEPEVDRPFRAGQVAHWIIHRQAHTFEEMTDLPLDLRRRLSRRFTLAEPEVTAIQSSQDGSYKFLFRMDDGITVEAVAMPEGRKMTLCLSSQTGCALGCVFCVTGALGPGRNLTAEEMVGQYRAMLRALESTPERVNIVFMGMGEPLLNTDELGPALEVLFERVSPRRITVSTAGVVPGIRWLAGRPRRPKLAISLNAPDQARREALMPIARRYPLDALMAEIRSFPLERGRRITFEYVLIQGRNDSDGDARALAALLQDIPSKLNLIPFNEDREHLPDLAAPTGKAVQDFAELLRRRAGCTVTVRRSKGDDIAAACGRLKRSSDPPT